SYRDLHSFPTRRSSDLIKHCPYVIENSKALTLADAEQNLQEYSLIIQTTSIGMYPNINDCIISLEKLNKNAMVSDIVYNPFETRSEEHTSELQSRENLV